MDSILRIGFTAIVITFVCAACGGGGGGEEAPPEAPTQVVMTVNNAHQVALLGSAFLESPVQIALSVLDNVFDLNDAGQVSATLNCQLNAGTQGSVSLELSDTDGDGLVGTGESVNMIYTDCFQASLNDVATGEIDVEIVSLLINMDRSTTGEIRVSIPTNLQFTAQDGTWIQVSGSFSVRFTGTSDQERLHIAMQSGDRLTVQVNDGTTTFTEVGTNIEVDRHFDTSGMFVVTGSTDIDSEIVDGLLSCEFASGLTGTVAMLPSGGVLRCAGHSNSAVRVTVNTDGSIATEVDAQGNGFYTNVGVIDGGNGIWTDYSDGILFNLQLDLPEVAREFLVPSVTTESLGIAVNNAVYDAVGDRLFVTNDTGVVVVDAASLTVAGAIPINNRPDAIDVSDDGSTVWVGFRDAGEIVPIATATLTPGAAVSLGIDPMFGGPRIAFELRIAPGTTDTVVTTLEGNREVIAFAGGSPLSNIVSDFSAPTIIEFRDANTVVGIDTSVSNYPISLMTLGTDGIVLDKLISNYVVSRNESMSLDGATLWGSLGVRVDIDSEDVVGSLDLQQLGHSGFRAGVFFDRDANRVYLYSAFDQVLEFHDADAFTVVGAYRIPVNGNLLKIVERNADELFLITDVEVHRVQKSDLLPNLTSRGCSTVDLGGQLGLDFMIQVDCKFNDVVYDANRDVLYASVPSAVGPDGNSVAVIDPATGEILEYIFVGSEPTKLSVSGSGNRLYVALSGATFVAEVDLNTRQLASTIRLEPESFTRPPMPKTLVASPVSDTDFVVSTFDHTAFYTGGIQAANVAVQAGDLRYLFFRSTGSRVYGLDQSASLFAWDVDSTGLTSETLTRFLPIGLEAKIESDVLYDRNGNSIDPETGSIDQICPVAGMTGLEPDPNSDDIYFFKSTFDDEIHICDQSTGSVGAPVALPRFDGGISYRALTKAGANRIALTGQNKMWLLDPGEF